MTFRASIVDQIRHSGNFIINNYNDVQTPLNTIPNANYPYHFIEVSNVASSMSQAMANVTLPGVSPENNILFRFTGQTQELTLKFPILNDGTDRSNGVHSSRVVTIADQIRYLRRNIFVAHFGARFVLVLERYFPGGVDGMISSLSLPSSESEENIIVGSITFKLGKLAGGVGS